LKSIPKSDTLRIHSLPGFQQFIHQRGDKQYEVFFAGEGPPVIVIHELPGMVPECIEFAGRLIDAGFTVYLPLLFGKPGEKAPLKFTLHVCISREFYLLASKRTSPVVFWLRDLCRRVHKQHGGRGAGAIGMCLTGGFAIPMMVEPSLVAPAVSQPSLPLPPIGKTKRRALGASPKDLERARQRTREEGITIKAYRFDRDPIVPRERMDAYREVFGDAFQYTELPCDQQKPFGKGCHSVFSIDFVDEPGHPTRNALEDLIGFFRERLGKGNLSV
jgi:dienelactone hydrolase